MYPNQSPAGTLLETENMRMPMVEVRALGRFEIYVDDQLVSGQIGRSKKLKHLAEYLILNHHRAVPNDEIIEALWPNEESKNPRNALKILVHRLRTTLAAGGAPQDMEFIIARQRSCRWNPALDCIYDFEHFEALCTAGLSGRASEETARVRLLDACKMYHGRFMSDASGEVWVSAPEIRMHTYYLRAVNRLIEILHARGQFDLIIQLCRQALTIDQMDENINRQLIFALAESGRNQEAIQHYNQITELYYSQLGVQPSEELRGLYHRIAAVERKVGADIDSTSADLRESDAQPGAFVCPYEIFKDIYRLQARSLARYGGRAFVALLTVTDNRVCQPESKTLAKVMERLMESARLSLRRGDMIARYSPAQLVILLPTVTYDMGQMVCERLTRNFKRENPSMNVAISYNLRPMEPPRDKEKEEYPM